MCYDDPFVSSFCSYVGSITNFRKGEQKWNAFLKKKKAVVFFNIEASKMKRKTTP